MYEPMRPAATLVSPAQFSLKDLDLLDHVPSKSFDAITRLASRIFDVPVSLISVIDDDRDRQVFASHVGLMAPWDEVRQTPLSHSFCKYVKDSAAPLIVPYSLDSDLVRNNLAVRALNVIAYLGAPIFGPDGKALGALCVISGKERHWTNEDVATLEDLARCVSDEITLRASVLSQSMLNRHMAHLNERTRRYNALREQISSAFMRPNLRPDQRLSAVLEAGCDALNMAWGRICRADGHRIETLCHVDRSLPGEPASTLSNGLSAYVMTGQEMVCMPDVHGALGRRRCNKDLLFPGSFIGAPLIMDGVLYGTLEFSHPAKRSCVWTEEETSMINVVSMFVCGHLGIFGQLEALRQSEAALASYVADIQSRNRIRSVG